LSIPVTALHTAAPLAPAPPAPGDVATAAELMLAFAARTGLEPAGPPRRYLWTDAFAVCNLLELHRLSGDPWCRELALRLVAQVHEVLGRHRDDDPRQGWISGLDEEEGRQRPTAGGLRIGKELPERSPREPLQARLEWDRDGQYFHYLTRWAHALLQAAGASREERFLSWAAELAVVAQDRFTQRPPNEPPRMVWKMSVTLTRPLVASMGQHDPLDGWVTALSLLAAGVPEQRAGALRRAAGALAELAGRTRWATDDPLGLGSLLVDAWRVAQLQARGAVDDPTLLPQLLDECRRSFAAFSAEGLRQPAAQRLAFRELGLALGLVALERLAAWSAADPTAPPALRSRIAALERWVPLGAEIVGFWREPSHRVAATWAEHRDISAVMLATALVPDGYLTLPPPLAAGPDPAG
jgi:hypothetical protein